MGATQGLALAEARLDWEKATDTMVVTDHQRGGSATVDQMTSRHTVPQERTIQGTGHGSAPDGTSSSSSWGSALASPDGFPNTSSAATAGGPDAFTGSVASPHAVTVGFDVVPPPPIFANTSGAFGGAMTLPTCTTTPDVHGTSNASGAVDRGVSDGSGGKEERARGNFEGKGGHGGSVEGVYTFYQAVDTQPVFLHSVNMRCLLHEYGSGNTDAAVESCPAEVVRPRVDGYCCIHCHRWLGGEGSGGRGGC